MWLIELAAAVYLGRVLWPYAKRLRMPRWRVPTMRAVLAFCASAWFVLWVAHIIALALIRP